MGVGESIAATVLCSRWYFARGAMARPRRVGTVASLGAGTGLTFLPLTRCIVDAYGPDEVSPGAQRRVVLEILRRAVEMELVAHVFGDRVGPVYRRAGTADGHPYADSGQALAALERELGTVLRAVRLAARLGDTELVCALCRTLWPVQLKLGHLDEIVPALKLAVRMTATDPPDARVAARMHVQLGLALGLAADRNGFGRHSGFRGHGRPGEAMAHLRRAATMNEQAGDPLGQASAVEAQGLVRLRQRRWKAALALFEAAERILDRVSEDTPGFAELHRARALLLRGRGRALNGLGRRDEALALLTSARKRFSGIGDAYNVGRTLTDLAAVHLDRGAAASALPLVREAIPLLEREYATLHLGRLHELRQQCVNRSG